jgi:hypothetical protein
MILPLRFSHLFSYQTGETLDPPHQQQDDHNQKNQSKSTAGIVSPAPAVGPSGYYADQGENQNNDQYHSHFPLLILLFELLVYYRTKAAHPVSFRDIETVFLTSLFMAATSVVAAASVLAAASSSPATWPPPPWPTSSYRYKHDHQNNSQHNDSLHRPLLFPPHRKTFIARL